MPRERRNHPPRAAAGWHSSCGGGDGWFPVPGEDLRKTIDLIIGMFCIVRGHALLTADRDFAPMAEHLGLTLA
jgi:predicted nucleic acid-binding protein